uniref:Protein kinase domain-containing protein n=1 Tax=Chromera velia CCMP2878 TaxID=1169474 RepID=A0A0G4G9D7_9ALVE|eukprot:Cvel_584.t1-p1 / transcript=Cvel_584.t1 / gene=Cvel_584 / organism=Chromera_velia_CCMP2878 / gene_product=Cyclin-dependent kinase F-4, putative / transcript_product=Cyclin-dependent kinase F-4, putative / location=Cvel_scaffold18:57517-61576(+) / protein_length=598 / sequence_SO=supercontig / SO=protein_coding / is_pseudo=false
MHDPPICSLSSILPAPGCVPLEIPLADSICESIAKRARFQIFSALAHMHHRNTLHRDLTPQNVLLDKDGVLKVADMGWARDLTYFPNKDTYSAEEGVPEEGGEGGGGGGEGGEDGEMGEAYEEGGGEWEEGDLMYPPAPLTEGPCTRWYRAPECLMTDREYSFPVDMWSSGCMWVELLTLQPLFPGVSEADQYAQIVRVIGEPPEDVFAVWEKSGNALGLSTAEQFRTKKPFSRRRLSPIGVASCLPSVSQECADLIASLLDWRPSSRLSAAEILADPYFLEFRLHETEGGTFTAGLRGSLQRQRGGLWRLQRGSGRISTSAKGIAVGGSGGGPRRRRVKFEQRSLKFLTKLGGGPLTQELFSCSALEAVDQPCQSISANSRGVCEHQEGEEIVHSASGEMDLMVTDQLEGQTGAEGSTAATACEFMRWPSAANARTLERNQRRRKLALAPIKDDNASNPSADLNNDEQTSTASPDAAAASGSSLTNANGSRSLDRRVKILRVPQSVTNKEITSFFDGLGLDQGKPACPRASGNVRGVWFDHAWKAVAASVCPIMFPPESENEDNSWTKRVVPHGKPTKARGAPPSWLALMFFECGLS